MEWLVTCDIESDIAFLRRYPEFEETVVTVEQLPLRSLAGSESRLITTVISRTADLRRYSRLATIHEMTSLSDTTVFCRYRFQHLARDSILCA
jgi:hypothetical protein